MDLYLDVYDLWFGIIFLLKTKDLNHKYSIYKSFG